jgi:HD-GYP domain-containing protein (c-di-GMP phosphodiesterase class II)
MSRILGAVDAYEAMTAMRSYRRQKGPLSREQALEELHLNAGSQFDPEVVDAVCRVVQKELAEIETVEREARSSALQV